MKSLKVYIDTDVMIDTAVRIDRFPNSLKLLNDLIESPDFSLWTSAISLNNIEYIVSKIADREKAVSLLELIKDTFSIIPFRRSVFLSAFTDVAHDFEDQIQIASAEQFSMDYIITRNVEHFIKSKIPVLTPTQFLQAWDRGELGRFTTVPFLDLKAQHHQTYNEIDDKLTDVIANTGFILGKYVEEFEKGFAEAVSLSGYQLLTGFHVMAGAVVGPFRYVGPLALSTACEFHPRRQTGPAQYPGHRQRGDGSESNQRAFASAERLSRCRSTR